MGIEKDALNYAFVRLRRLKERALERIGIVATGAARSGDHQDMGPEIRLTESVRTLTNIHHMDKLLHPMRRLQMLNADAPGVDPASPVGPDDPPPPGVNLYWQEHARSIIRRHLVRAMNRALRESMDEVERCVAYRPKFSDGGLRTPPPFPGSDSLRTLAAIANVCEVNAKEGSADLIRKFMDELEMAERSPIDE